MEPTFLEYSENFEVLQIHLTEWILTFGVLVAHCSGCVQRMSLMVGEESYSAGQLYDKIGDEAYGKVLYVLSDGVLCELIDAGMRADDVLVDDDEEISF